MSALVWIWQNRPVKMHISCRFSDVSACDFCCRKFGGFRKLMPLFCEVNVAGSITANGQWLRSKLSIYFNCKSFVFKCPSFSDFRVVNNTAEAWILVLLVALSFYIDNQKYDWPVTKLSEGVILMQIYLHLVKWQKGRSYCRLFSTRCLIS